MGARDRVEGDRKRTILGSWLGGLLGGMVDPKTYPSLVSLIGEDEVPEVVDEEPDPEAAHAGAKLWIMFLNRR